MNRFQLQHKSINIILLTHLSLGMAIGVQAFFQQTVSAQTPAPAYMPPAANTSNLALTPAAGATSKESTPAHYGMFGWLDSRSQYGKGIFPEPFQVDDSDLEVNEFRLDWNHSSANGSSGNEMKAEIEHGFGLLTVEVEVPYEYNTSTEYDPSTGSGRHSYERGFDNIDLGARYPIYQYVSPDESIDSTFGVGIEVGIPTNTRFSKNTEVVPKMFNDLRIGEHFTLQTIVGYSLLYGSGDEGGNHSFEYGLDFGWSISHEELPIPGVAQLVPVFELSGETLVNTDEAGANALTGLIGFRANLDAIGRIQPRLGLGYVFPLDQGAREDLHWGIFTSLVFEF